jgi:hypothetical protein
MEERGGERRWRPSVLSPLLRRGERKKKSVQQVVSAWDHFDRY